MPPDLFCLSCFPGRVLCFLPGTSLDCDPPIYASHIAGITGMPLPCLVFLLKGGLTFCLGLHHTVIFLIAASQVARIKGVSHCTLPGLHFFFNSHSLLPIALSGPLSCLPLVWAAFSGIVMAWTLHFLLMPVYQADPFVLLLLRGKTSL
jgi:hypothetical protein